MRNIEYNEKQIKEILNNFKNKNFKPMDITIYFDMDNTLCIFSYNGRDDIALQKAKRKGFYRNLQCFEEAPIVIETLQAIGFNIKVLSSCINTTYCKPEKIAWIKYHFPSIKEEDIILVENGHNKAEYIEDISTSILIDDYYVNLMNWMDAGGVAIKKTFSGKPRPIPQVSNLTELFKILYDLNVFTNK